MNKEEVTTKLRHAFADLPPPTAVVHDSTHCDECGEIAGAFLARLHHPRPTDWLEDQYQSLPFLTPDALRYFLPAYMEHALNHPESMVFEFLLFHLGPNPKEADKTPDQLGFTASQIDAVRNFLKWAQTVAEENAYDELERGLHRWTVVGRTA